MKVVLRKEAKELGLYKYFTGEPCAHGHLSERYVANGHCTTCQNGKSRTAEARARQAEYRIRASEYQREYYKEWIKSNRGAKLEYMKKYSREVANPKMKMRYHSDPMFNFEVCLRSRLASILKAKKTNKTARTKDLVGCDFEELVSYIESRFKPGMSWENRSEWHIDHIIPLAVAETEDDLRRLFHYTNLQPLWAIENRRKGCRIEVSQC